MREGAVNIFASNTIHSPQVRAVLAPWPFAAAVAVLYFLGLAVQMLTAPLVLARLGLWPFLFMQPVLIGVWYVLHVRRLRDAGRGDSAAQGIAIIHALAVVLLVLVGAFYVDSPASEPGVPQSLVLVRELITFSRGTDDLVTWLGLVACGALLAPPVFSVWAALQPRRTA